MSSDKILWLTPKGGYSIKLRGMLDGFLRAANIPPASCMYFSLWTQVPNMLALKGKKTWVLNPAALKQMHEALDQYIRIAKPKLIVVNDTATNYFIQGGKTNSLNVSRGSVYYYKNIPCLIVDNLANIFAQRYGNWLFLNDIKKIGRWFHGKQRCEPRFDFSVCTTVNSVEYFCSLALQSPLISIDSETKSGFITCIGYTILVGGELKSFVVPFFTTQSPDGAFWSYEDECTVWNILRKVHQSRVYKCMQNGMYDSAYFVKYGVAPIAYFFDTYHLMHSIWPEAPKKLNFISSIMLDFCRYWKDETKGKKEDSYGTTELDMWRYWRYCALDTYHTFLNCLTLVNLVNGNNWAAVNYSIEFRLAVGPNFAMSMRGFKVNQKRLLRKVRKWQKEHEKNLAELRKMVDDPDFNPNSSDQVAQFLYDILGAVPTTLQTRKGSKYGLRSTDKKILELIKDQHPLFEMFIAKLIETKEPLNNVAKYSDLGLIAGRFYYWLDPAGTVTMRASGGDHMFWCGTNPQNIPAEVRDMFVADDDYYIVDIDYSQSDDFFIGYESQDPDKIALLQKIARGEIDGHCFHASKFFKRTYDEIEKGKKADAPWVIHPIRGVRNITKRIVHGRNFRMEAFTLFATIAGQVGRKAIIAAAHTLGYKDAHLWEDDKLIKLCGIFIEEYDNPKIGLYKRLRAWQAEIVEEAIKNGNRVTNAFGHTRQFFGNIAKDHAVQRELSSHYGQGGTSGNINRVCLEIFYNNFGLDDGKNLLLLLQVHDSLTFLVHKSALNRVKKVLTIMGAKVRIHGREFSVPTEAEIGLSWSKKMLKFREDITFEELKKFDYETFDKEDDEEEARQVTEAEKARVEKWQYLLSAAT